MNLLIKPIDLIPVASGMSDKQRNKEVVNGFIRTIDTSGLKIHEVITEINQLSASDTDKLRAVIIFVITGGTERLIAEVAKKARFSIIIAHKGMNSLPAAIEAKSLLNYLGINAVLLKNTESDAISKAIKSLKVLNAFPKRLALVGDPSPWLIYSSRNEVIDFLKEKLDAEIINISLDELIKKYISINDSLVYDELPKKLKSPVPKTLEYREVVKAFKLYLALKKLLEEAGTKVFGIRCFDLITELNTTACLPLALLNSEGYVAGCEGDIMALTSMIIGAKISGRPTFMGNLVWVDKDEVILAHCTSPLSLVSRYELMTHYESGIGVGVRGYMDEGSEVTLFKFDPLVMEAKILEGVIRGSGEVVQEGCRTQFIIKATSGTPNYLLDKPSGNHYVLINGHFRKELKYIAGLLGFTVEGI